MAHWLDKMRGQCLAAGYSIGNLAKKAGVGDWAIITAGKRRRSAVRKSSVFQLCSSQAAATIDAMFRG
jgi:hypothetical protein